MQDGAPAHTSNSTQTYLVDHLGAENFWDKELCPPSSPDANPLDFSFWSALAGAVTGGPMMPKNRDQLVKAIEDRWLEVLKPEFVEKTCSAAWERLRRIVDADGGYIERIRTMQTTEDEDVDDNNNVV